MNLKLCILLFTNLLSLNLVSQEVSLTAKVSKNKLGINQRLKVEFSVNKQGGDNFSPPSFRGFKMISGPSQSISQSWINGRASFSQSYSYVIEPTKKGELIIGAASIDFGANTIKSNPVKVIVLDAVELPKDPNDPNYIAQQNIHLVAEVSKHRPYVGEGIYVEYRLYVSQGVSVFDTNVISVPQYNGFWNQSIKIKDYNVKKGKYNGEDYRYIVLQKALLIPTKTGSLTIDPMKMDVAIGVPTGRADFFGNIITRNIRKEFSSAKKTIRPKSLPSKGKPKNFNGAVGNFDFGVTLSKDKLKTNESSQINVKVSGKGNINLFELPEIVVPVEIEKYQPERKEKVKINSRGIYGSITNIYTVVPLFKGKYKIPSVSFSYFNPKKKKYKTISTKDFYVDVLDGKKLITNSNNNIVNKRDVKLTGDSFRYIQTKTTFKPIDNKGFFKTTLFYLLLILPIIVSLASIFIIKKYESYSLTIAGNKSRKAERLSKKYLSEAKNKIGDKESFYESLEIALHNYLKAKLGVETADISKEKITSILEDKKVSKDLINQFLEILKNCEMARYSPITHTKMEVEFKTVKQALIQLDKQL